MVSGDVIFRSTELSFTIKKQFLIAFLKNEKSVKQLWCDHTHKKRKV